MKEEPFCINARRCLACISLGHLLCILLRYKYDVVREMITQAKLKHLIWKQWADENLEWPKMWD